MVGGRRRVLGVLEQGPASVAKVLISGLPSASRPLQVHRGLVREATARNRHPPRLGSPGKIHDPDGNDDAEAERSSAGKRSTNGEPSEILNAVVSDTRLVRKTGEESSQKRSDEEPRYSNNKQRNNHLGIRKQ